MTEAREAEEGRRAEGEPVPKPGEAPENLRALRRPYGKTACPFGPLKRRGFVKALPARFRRIFLYYISERQGACAISDLCMQTIDQATRSRG